jgi:hypothetical protein
MKTKNEHLENKDFEEIENEKMKNKNSKTILPKTLLIQRIHYKIFLLYFPTTLIIMIL